MFDPGALFGEIVAPAALVDDGLNEGSDWEEEGLVEGAALLKDVEGTTLSAARSRSPSGHSGDGVGSSMQT